LKTEAILVDIYPQMR